MPRDLRRDYGPGDELTSSQANAWSEAAELVQAINADPSSGLEIAITPAGIVIRAKSRLECWARVTASLGSGRYAGLQVIERADGTWADGSRVFDSSRALIEVSGNAQVLSGASSRIVRAWRDRFNWRFAWGACG